MTRDFKPGDTATRNDGSTGTVERVTGERVTVKFPGWWRSSVMLKKNLTLVTEPDPECKSTITDPAERFTCQTSS